MRKGELRRQTILESAGRLFFERGYVKTSIEDIIEALGCSKGSFYHHFTSKLAVLEAFCHDSVKENYALYQSQLINEPFDALNALLYFSHPFRDGDKDMLKMILTLRFCEESSVVISRMRLALREVFSPELDQLLTRLKSANLVHFTLTKMPDLLWETHTAFFEAVIACVVSHSKSRPALAGQLRDIVNAERFLWERVLDAPFGSIQIVSLDEILSTVSYASTGLEI
jgi:AcrR family transcriptional regulator